MDFDVIPHEDIDGDWKKLGSGSFGNVYKASYLGIDVAIKEVLPSNDYDVRKYFEREWRLMKEARHPNVVLYLGLSRAPDGRIFIISEYIENGNLRQYIHDKSKPFGWRLRLSFMTDIARALAYLHARKCIHRDLKGENLLVTSNGRLKITDFGFARIAARNEEESKRLTFCGTDSYMSPEILVGDEFDLPTDIFSLGVIFCEIISRKLADEHIFKRTAPYFGIDADEVRKLASPGCPPELIALALECCETSPAKRPTMVTILSRLRAIEIEVASREAEADQHVGSIKFLSASKRPNPAPRIPSFGAGMGSGIRMSQQAEDIKIEEESTSDDGGDTDEELEAAIKGLQSVRVKDANGNSSKVALGSVTTSSWISPADIFKEGNGTRIAGDKEKPLIDIDEPAGSAFAEYSTTVIRSHKKDTSATAPSIASILTARPIEGEPGVTAATTAPMSPPMPKSIDSLLSIDTYHTAKGLPSVMAPSIAAATEGSHAHHQDLTMASSSMSASPSAMHHRFTLIKPGSKRSNSTPAPIRPTASHNFSPVNSPTSTTPPPAWSPFDFFFFSGGLGAFSAKCDLCGKRLGWKPLLECDDCGLRPYADPIELTAKSPLELLASKLNTPLPTPPRTPPKTSPRTSKSELSAHLRCGEMAPNDCGLRPPPRPLPQNPPISLSPMKTSQTTNLMGVTSNVNNNNNNNNNNKRVASLASTSHPNLPSSAPK
ncbi:hypothetical protein FRB96_002003 [Tulasnella sp. 330]|nr:hypothetical protein FRB96_002003 [Tulasnella sp. 330]